MPNRMEEMASKGMGAMKAVKAQVTGLHGVFKKLAQEHGEVTALLVRVKASRDPETRGRLFPKIRSELLAHEKAELKVVYSALEARPELQHIVRDHDTEAREMERMLEQLAMMPYTDDAWGETFDKLVGLVSHHASEEEGDYFPAAEKVLGKEQVERMLSSYEAAKADVMRLAM